MKRTRTPSLVEKFMARVDATGGPDACHLWLGNLSPHGYGRFFDGERKIIASRWLLGYLRSKPLARGEEACHTCDNPTCVNPRHLYIGTRQTNMRDMWERGRAGGVTGKNARKTHCDHGHEFTAENTMPNPAGGRRCRACHRQDGRNHAARAKQVG